MIAFLSFLLVMSFTPGPNTIMAMVSGQQRGFRRSVILNIGMAFGMLTLGVLAAFFASWLQNTPTFITIMKIVGSVYLLYLAYHVAVSTPDTADNRSGGFWTGMLLQLTNIKVYLYFITGLAAFSLTGIFASIPARLALMIVIGSIGTFAWTGAGQLINRIYLRYFHIVNGIVAVLLILAAIDLW
jgi:cysteine/O-acetylserine efflux protein